MDVTQFSRLAGGLVLAYLALAALFVFRPLPSRARRVFAGLTVAEIIIAFLYTRTWDRNLAPFLSWLFDLNREFGLGATLSSAQLIAVAVMATAIGLLNPAFTRWRRRYWLLIAGVFVFLSLDEYFLIHEAYYLAGGVWQIPYAIGGATVFLVSIFAWWRWFRGEKLLFLLLFGGLALMGAAGIVMDYVVQEVICIASGPGCHRFVIIEEFSEMAGVTLALASLVAFAEARLQPGTLRRMGRMAAAGGAVWLVFLVSYLWLLPGLEANFSATPARVTWLDGALELTGYRLSDEMIAPGGDLEVTLYFRANDFLEGEYSVSANLFSHPDVDSVANADMLLGEYNYPTFGWLPGAVVRNRLRVPVPPDLATNRSYWLVARVWQDAWQNGLSIGEAEARLFDETTAILTGIAAPDNGDIPEPPFAANYVFADGFALAGYDLPDQVAPGATLALRFWWQTRQDIDRNLTQFVHLRHLADDRIFAFDQPPFGSRYPTQDWPGGMTMIDPWQTTLPSDLPAGEYVVYTGLYAPATLERAVVRDASGASVADNAIRLGEIVVAEAEDAQG